MSRTSDVPPLRDGAVAPYKRPPMRSLPALLALCLLGSLLASWWLLAGQPAAPPPAPSSATEPTTPATAAADVAEASLRAAPSPVGETAGAIDDPLDESTNESTNDGDRTAAEADQRRAPRVLVVRGEPPMPVADATVFFVQEEHAQQRLGANPQGLGRWDWPEAIGQRAVTGADGIAHLPVAEAPWLCTASAGDGFGNAIVPPRDRTFTITLVTDEQISLVAHASDDTPAAGIPLALVQQLGGNEGAAIWQGRSNEHGRALVRHFQLLRQASAGQPGGERFAAVPAVPDSIAVEFVGRPASKDDIVLKLPPLGSVRLLLVDHRGLPILSRATVGLSAVFPSTMAGPSPMTLPRHLNLQRREKPLGSEWVVLPFHDLRSQVHVYARYALDRRQAELGPVPGPQRPGEVIDLQLPLRNTQTVLAGRLTLNNAPLRLGTVEAAIWQGERDVLPTTVETIADGRFDIVLRERLDAAECWLELRLDPRPLLPAKAAAPAPLPMRVGARVRVPALRGGQRVELGNIELTELPACATGLVIDDQGQPVADADVHVQLEVLEEGGRQRDPWRTLPLFRTRSDASGRFTIDGKKPPGRLRVRADTDKHFADSVPLAREGQDLRIKIDRNGILRGRVLLPDWLADGATSLQLRPFDEAQRAQGTRSLDLSRRGGGRFTIEPLRPGRFDALVLLRGMPAPLAIVQDVFVQPGETRDQRFRPLDLREALHRFRLRAVDNYGQPFPLDGPILASCRQLDGTVNDATFRWQKGRAELITTAPVADLVFFGRGHQTVRLTLNAGESDVRLPTVQPALLELPGARALCGPTRKVRVSVLLQGETSLPGSLAGIDQRTGERFAFHRRDLGRSSGAWLEGNDTVEIPLLQSGRYEVLLRPHAGDTERSPQGQISLGTFELHIDSPSRMPVRVPVDPVTVGQALLKLDQDWQRAQAQPNQPNGQPPVRTRNGR